MTRPIAPSNDFDVGLTPADDVPAGLTGITAWLSEQADHSTDDPAPVFDPALSKPLAEAPAGSHAYPGSFPGAVIDEHVIDIEEPPEHLYLHRADDAHHWTAPPVRCRVYGRRFA